MIIKINNMNWEIKEVESSHSMLLVSGAVSLGTSHFLHKEIYLNKDLKPEHKQQILRHELTHAFMSETQISDKDTFDEEELCEFVGLYGQRISEIAERYSYIEDEYKDYELSKPKEPVEREPFNKDTA